MRYGKIRHRKIRYGKVDGRCGKVKRNKAMEGNVWQSKIIIKYFTAI